jgi:subtilisin-like proprotein convertase family protein
LNIAVRSATIEAVPAPRLVLALAAVTAAALVPARPAAGALVPVRDAYSSGNLATDVSSGATSNLAVPDSGAITTATVSVRLHADDLRAIGLRLHSPGGASYDLFRPGDASGTDLGSGAADCSGMPATFAVPTGIAGKDSAGTWTLQVTNASATSGTLSCWQLDVTHRQEAVRHGTLTAELGYLHQDQPTDGQFFKNVRLRIFSGVTLLYAAGFPNLYPAYAFTRRNSVSLVDLDGDGRPEVLLWLYSGGAHCCFSVRVFQVSGATVRRSARDFGDPGARLKRVGGRLLFVSADDRFAYAFTSFAASGLPVQLWRWRANRFVDVTRSHLGLVRADRDAWWRYTKGVLRQKGGDARGLLAAWAADECLLGRRAAVRAELAKLLRAGKLSGPSEWLQGRAYVNALWKLLRKLGYTP